MSLKTKLLQFLKIEMKHVEVLLVLEVFTTISLLYLEFDDVVGM